ncbi:hypothetical protein ARMSODRAFT_964210 [Armillaria solidipes]|uniref:Uncharacterized protein n=1 Tax=Armillaria solidipes TaxID=1076256 RepID=A0A2H3BEV8_9AGAR|nr:hypothetical protein ARMSODRAFT_964210 [Armillaria solidipes]
MKIRRFEYYHGKTAEIWRVCRFDSASIETSHWITRILIEQAKRQYGNEIFGVV